MITVQRTGAFDRLLEELCRQDHRLLAHIEERILWFRKNPLDTRLNNHALKKRLSGKWAFFITNDIRILYEWLGKSTVRFLAIGGHSDVYKNR